MSAQNALFVEIKPPTLDLKNHIVICNWAVDGETIIAKLCGPALLEQKTIVIVSEDAASIPATGVGLGKAKGLVWAVPGDPSEDNVLELANIREASAVIVLTDQKSHKGGFEEASIHPADVKTIHISLAVKRLAPEVYLCVELAEERDREFLLRANADEIVSGEGVGAKLIAQAALTHSATFLYQHLLNNAVDTNEPYLVMAPDSFIGATFRQLQEALLPEEVILVGLKTSDGAQINPKGELTIEPGDELFVIGYTESEVQRIIQKTNLL